MTRELIHPSEIKIGDHLRHFGIIYKVTKIKIIQTDNLPKYCIAGVFVTGNKEDAILFYEDFPIITKQANERHRWIRVTL